VGVTGPRTPAVHRGARILDAIASGAANSPAALSGVLGLAKSSIADLVGALENDDLVGRSGDGRLHIGPRWAGLSDPAGVVDRLLSVCARTPDLDGHTLSIVEMFGNQVVCLDVRSGRYPLPLTPRPGQRTMAADSAGAVAILSSMSAAQAADFVGAASGHLGLSEEQVRHTVALRHAGRRTVHESASPQTGRQFACAVPGTRLALTLHLPDRWSERGFVRRAGRALAAAAADTDADARPVTS
jgi:IclR family transcriptional regulator, blcABC operon repressor